MNLMKCFSVEVCQKINRIYIIHFLIIFVVACAPKEGPHRPLPQGEAGSNEIVSGAPKIATGDSATTSGLATGGNTRREARVSHQDVRPIFAQFCASCHPSRSIPNWLELISSQDYLKSSEKRNKFIDYVWVKKHMPLPGSPEAAMITDNDRRKLANYAQSVGLPPVASIPNAAATTETSTGTGAAISIDSNAATKPTVTAGATSNNSTNTTSGMATSDTTQSPVDGLPPPVASTASNVPKSVESCLHCHGGDAVDESSQPKIPILVGQNQEYMILQLEKFKWNQRKDPSNTMNTIAGDMEPGQMEEVARFYSSKKRRAPPVSAETAQKAFSALGLRGEKLAKTYCNGCHYKPERGNIPVEQNIPVIAGQIKIYLRNQLLYFRDNERRSRVMHVYAKLFKSKEDIEALATYFSEIE